VVGAGGAGGRIVTRLSMASAIRAALDREMARDDTVILMGEDVSVSVFGATAGLAERYGKARVIDTPISESAFLGAAVGAAATGLKPVVELMFCDFLGVGFDAVLNQVGKLAFLSGGQLSLPLVLRASVGAGDSSAAQHSQSLQHIFAAIPGLKVAMPSSPADAMGLTLAAIREPGPVILLEHKLLYEIDGEVPDPPVPQPLGRAKIMREGRDITLVAAGRMVHLAQQAAERLAKQGMMAEVIDLRTLKPLDEAVILRSLRKTGRLLVVDEGAAHCGIAAEITALAACKAFEALKCAPRAITPPDTPVPFSPPLEAAWLPSAEAIADAAHRLMLANRRRRVGQ